MGLRSRAIIILNSHNLVPLVQPMVFCDIISVFQNWNLNIPSERAPSKLSEWTIMLSLLYPHSPGPPLWRLPAVALHCNGQTVPWWLPPGVAWSSPGQNKPSLSWWPPPLAEGPPHSPIFPCSLCQSDPSQSAWSLCGVCVRGGGIHCVEYTTVFHYKHPYQVYHIARTANYCMDMSADG